MGYSLSHYKAAITEVFEYHKEMVEKDRSKYQLAEDGFKWALNLTLDVIKSDNSLSTEEFSKLNTYVGELCDAFLKLKTV